MNFDKITILDETDATSKDALNIDNEALNIDIACYALSSDAENVKQVMTEYEAMKNAMLQRASSTLKTVAAKASVKRTAMPFSMPTISNRTDFPNHITHRDITTKPEDQGSLGTCAMWTATTVCEMILWKLTGKYMEFSDDEIYNIYLDCQAGYGQMFTYSYQYLITNSYQRMNMRKSATDWKIHELLDKGERYYLDQWGKVIGDDAIKNTALSPWYHILHYNDDDHRKNHYPDKFSEICFIAKNYIDNSIYRIYNTTGKNGKEDQLSPNEVKHLAFCSNFPMKSGIPGHAVTFYEIDQSNVDFNSSWNASDVCVLRFPYQNVKPYYKQCTNTQTGKVDTRFGGGLQLLEYFDRKLESASTAYQLRVSQAEHVHVIGTAEVEQFKSGEVIQLSACPDDGYYFKCWSDGNTDNPCQVLIDSDKTICAEVSRTVVDDILYKLSVLTSDTFTISAAISPQVNSNGKSGFKYGTLQTLKCIPQNGAKFVEWGNGISANPYVFSITQDTTICPVVNPSIQISTCNCKISNTEFYMDKYPVKEHSAINDRVGMYFNITHDRKYLRNEIDFTLNTLKETVYSDGEFVVQINGKGNFTGTSQISSMLRRYTDFDIIVGYESFDDSGKLIYNIINDDESVLSTYGTVTHAYICELTAPDAFKTTPLDIKYLNPLNMHSYKQVDSSTLLFTLGGSSWRTSHIYPTSESNISICIEFTPSTKYDVVDFTVAQHNTDYRLTFGALSSAYDSTLKTTTKLIEIQRCAYHDIFVHLRDKS